MALLEIKNLRVEFATGRNPVRAVDGVSFEISAGETVCVVGESGSGKSVTALSIARLLPSPPARFLGGEVLLDGQDVLRMDQREVRSIRGRVVSYIFQNPSTSLNPVMKIAEQILESLRLHQPDRANEKEVIRLLQMVRIPAPEMRLNSYPYQLSGGMQQRVMIAMALASNPKLLVADEPTTALDVTIQAQILDSLRELRKELGMSILLITHNLGIVNQIADRVIVMYGGQVVESAAASTLFQKPLHPYTRALMGSVPKLGRDVERLESIPGSVPDLRFLPQGCRFYSRCNWRRPQCAEKAVELVEVEPGHWVRCPFWEQNCSDLFSR